ncbi:50S ribosomal protein L5 [Methylacidimicrobium cyclopophantes]|uniref:Large ribosomal subunit protein uL5 n=1 Tax=Methylacidimicrobium cyclopophantes TaxID=1041766 RepID=A0A5E6M8Z1_9BACT|nr:50S ribosomal protein L5 [Methylacidimicrobium cyclopophantes]VVM05854.1 50S ribosomal protein L5 [Methylacidimicrobium cyclopophantes]
MSEQSVFAKTYREQILPQMREARGYVNVHEVPRLEKVVINCCVGSSPELKTALEEALNDLATITGQRPVKTKAKKSISNFKLRQGQEIGCKVTLRGRRMYEFVERLIWAALPRVRDFRGLSPRGFDGKGNYTFGIRDHTVFPEIEMESVKRTFGFDVTIVTTARSTEEARDLLSRLGLPFIGARRETAPAKG